MGNDVKKIMEETTKEIVEAQTEHPKKKKKTGWLCPVFTWKCCRYRWHGGGDAEDDGQNGSKNLYGKSEKTEC